MERVYGALMTHTLHQNRARATVAVVNAIPKMYSCDTNDNVSIMGRVLSHVPDFVVPTSVEYHQLMSSGQFVWVSTFLLKNSRRWQTGDWICILHAGQSVSVDSFFCIAGILASHHGRDINNSFRRSNEPHALFLLRKVVGLKSRRFFPESSLFHYLTSDDLSGNVYLGEQMIRNPSSLCRDDVAMCPVVEYRLENDDVVLIPMCGMVSWD